MCELELFIEQIKTNPENIEFQTTIDIIDKYYYYHATRFLNGPHNDNIINNAGENEGSCKIFSFAQIHQLNVTQTLHCFGQFYRHDVLNYPENTNHANIRTFMKYGWNNITFDNQALKRK